MPNSSQLLTEIREANLTYLMLAQQLLREDKDTAMYRLGIGSDVADVLDGLTPAQISRMATSNLLLCRFRCDDRSIFETLAGHHQNPALAHAHSAILLSGQPVEKVN